MSPTKRLRKLKSLVRAGLIQPGPGCLTCTAHDKSFIADLGIGGEVFFDGLCFLNPENCLTYINGQYPCPHSSNGSTDRFQEFQFKGLPLSHYYDLLLSKENTNDRHEASLTDNSTSSTPTGSLMELKPTSQPTKESQDIVMKDTVRRSSRLRNKVGTDNTLNALADLEEQGEEDKIHSSRGKATKTSSVNNTSRTVRTDLIRNDEETQSMLLDVLADADETWLFCNNCHKWRRSRADPNIPSPWFCELNSEKKYASCKVAQELPSFAVDRLCNEESDHFYAITSGRPALDECTAEEFERDLVGFWSFLGEQTRADMIRLQRIQCNNSTMDLFGLYCEVVKWGGMMLNESYDAAGRYTGAINFSGQIFPNLKNYTPGHRATSIGNQLLVNYRKYLYDYERIWHEQDLALFAKWSPAAPPIKRHIRQKRDYGLNLELEPFPFVSAPSLQETGFKAPTSNLLMLAEVMLGVEKNQDRQKFRRLNSSEALSAEEEKRISDALCKAPSHRFKPGQLLLARDSLCEERYWPVLYCRQDDLPINIRNGQANEEAQKLSFPYTIKELLHCMGDYIPVMVIGTKAFGWVPAMFCRSFKTDIAMPQYKESLKVPEEAQYISLRRAYKEALQHCRNRPCELRAASLVQKQSLVQIRDRLLGLEMDIPMLLLGRDSFPTRDIWRDRVEQTHSPSQLAFEVQALSNQIDSKCFKKQSHKAVLEKIIKLLDHKKQEVSISNLDRAVALLEEAMDWPKIQKLVLAKTVPSKSEKHINIVENPEGPVEQSQHKHPISGNSIKDSLSIEKKVPRVKFVATGSKRKIDDADAIC